MIEGIIKKAKSENKKVYVYAHKFPDGDAISSSCAIVEYLKNYEIDAIYVVTNEVRSYRQVVGEIPTTKSVDQDSISIIVDTSTLNYAENRLFMSSSKADTYVIDHHGKQKGSFCLEDELQLPNENVIRNPNASSTCEILVDELDGTKLSPKIADMLTLGLLTDTAKLKFLKENTLSNLSKLLNLGANYNRIVRLCNRKNNLRNEVGLAKVLLSAKKFDIGNSFGLILPLNNGIVSDLNRNYGIRNPQKKIFKMADIENCSFNCVFAENNPGRYDVEFRSSKSFGDLDVLSLAISHNGGGHYAASGCNFYSKDGFDTSLVTSTIISEAQDRFSSKANSFEPIIPNELDNKLSRILDSTNRLTTGIAPETLASVDDLIKKGANYDYTFKEFKTFERFMLENEVLCRVPDNLLFTRNPNVNISLSPKDLDELTKKYNISEDEILDTINIFGNIFISSASINLPNGKRSHIDKYGNISFNSQKEDKQNTDDLEKA